MSRPKVSMIDLKGSIAFRNESRGYFDTRKKGQPLSEGLSLFSMKGG